MHNDTREHQSDWVFNECTHMAAAVDHSGFSQVLAGCQVVSL